MASATAILQYFDNKRKTKKAGALAENISSNAIIAVGDFFHGV